ncbi:MAG: Ig-like domain repeat protein [Rhodanobacteraceae bacterium]|nr:Ig-like domain repeat protein [Rhodanobacteraceae bacterium]
MNRVFQGALALAALGWGLCAIAGSEDVVIPEAGELQASKSGSTDFTLAGRSGNLLRVQANASYNSRLPDGALNAQARQQIASLVLEELGDHYDFIIVAPTMQVDLGNLIYGLHWQVHNDVQGIGRPMLDLRAQFGGAQRLKAVIDLDDAILPVSFTAVEYDGLLDTLMHEVMHQWASYVPMQIEGSPLATQASHWSSRFDSDASVMLGARWQAVEAQRWRQVKVRDGFGPLDLYLAGFIPATEVPPARYLLTDDLQGTELPELGRTVQGEERWVTSQDLLSVLGPRVPAHDQAQREFNAALVSLEPAGYPAGAAELDRLELLRAQAQSRFAALSGGRARLVLGIQAASVQPMAGSPQSIGSDAAPRPSLDLAAATQFLLDRRAEDLWQDKASSRIPDSLRALSALSADPSQNGVVAAARARLEGWNAQTMEHLAALLRVPDLPPARRRLLLQGLVAMQQADGGFGLAGDHKSAILDTALAVQALAHARSVEPESVLPAVIDHAVASLMAGRNATSNCWGAQAGTCEFLSTVTAVAALASAGVNGQGEAVFRWQQLDGGFGESAGATPFETALALNALSLAGMHADSRLHLGRAWLAGQQLADGSWGGSVAATAEALLFFRRDSRPDLRVDGNVRLQPELPVQGQAVTIRFDVHNAGVQPAPASSLIVELQTVSGGPWQMLAGVEQSPPLAGGVAVPLQLTWETSSFSPGEYRLRIRVDSTGLIEELDETNNTAERMVNLASPPVTPDLAVKDAQVDLVPNVVTSVPQAVSVRFTVENLGLTAVDNAAIRIHGYRFGELLPLHTVSRMVAAQSRVAIDESVQLTDADVSRIVVLIDPDNGIAEAREDNNRAEAVIQRTATVDLAVLPADIVAPAGMRTGTPAEFAVTLRNLGTSDSPTARLQVDVRRSDGSTSRLADQDVQVPAGGSIQRLVQWVPDLAGASALMARIDALDQVVEINEGNNQAETGFEVLASTLPNLKAVAGGWQIVPDPALEGTTAQLGLTVVNDSAHAASAFSVEFAAAPAGSTDFQSLGSVRVAAGLTPGASQLLTLQTPALSGPYARQLVARIDVGTEVTETNEGDNLALQLMQVLSLPNLQLVAIDTRLTPAQPAPGASVRLTATLRNTGQQPVPSTAIELHRLAADGAPSTPLAPSQAVVDLEPGAERAVEFEFIRPDGALRIELAADRANAIAEGREDDNRAILDLDTTDPDFYVTEPYFSPNGDGRADQTEIVARLTPPAAARVRVLTSWGEEVLSYGDGSVVAQLGGVWDGRRGDGRRALDDRYEVRLESATGQLLKRLPLVLDTNRRPLVLAARDGNALVESLDCGVSTHFDQITGMHGLDFVLRAGGLGVQSGLYRYGFDGSARLLLPTSAFPNSWGFTSVGLLDEHTVAVAALSAEGLELAAVDVDSGSILQPPTVIGHGAKKYVGRLLDGSLIFEAEPSGVVGWSPSTGQGSRWDSVSPDFQKAYTFGTDRVLVSSHSGVHLVGPAGGTLIDRIPRLDDEIWKAARFSYSRVDRAFYWSPGAQSLWRPTAVQILRIDERTGAVTAIVTSETSLANLAADVSPSGRYLIMSWGAEARARIRDLSAGTELDVDLSDVVPTDVPPRIPDMPMGRGVFEFHWSPDETHVAARFEAYQNPEPVSIEKFEGSNIYVLGSRGLLIEVASGQVRDLGDFSPRGWIEGELQLLGEQDGIALERGAERWPLLPSESTIEIAEHFPYRSSGLSTVFRRDSFGGCPQQYVHALSNRGNGFARLDLEYVEALRTMVVRISADDQNLDSYLLEYQLESGGVWTGVLDGTEAVDDQVIGSWSPPAPGRYRLRLRVVDRAGNIAQTVKELVWFDAEALGTVQADLRHISPNGDGVKDRLTLRYEIRSAIELDVRIESGNGTLLQTERLQHPLSGRFEWRWEGRAQDGSPLPDGTYRISFAGRSFVVEIDNSLPDLEITENPPAITDCLPNPTVTRRSYGTVRLNAVDQGFDHVRLESRPRDGSSPWIERVRYESAFVPEIDFNLKPQELRNEEHRVVAVDQAGNIRTEVFEVLGLGVHSARLVGLPVSGPSWHVPGRGQVLTPVMTWPRAAPPSAMLLGVMARSTEGWQLEFREPAGNWQSLPYSLVTPGDVPSPERSCFHGDETWLRVELPPLPGRAEFRMRRQIGGNMLQSNEFRVERDPEGGPPISSGGSANGDGGDLCTRVGTSVVSTHLGVPPLPFAQPASVHWFDSRNGSTVQLPLIPRPAGQLIAVDISGLPIGEHVLQVNYTDGSSQTTTVGRSTESPPAPTVERPQPNNRLCIGDPASVTGRIDHPFVEGISAQIGSDHGFWVGREPGRESDFQILPRPDQLPGLRNAAPIDWQIETWEQVGLPEGPATLRVRSLFCERYSPAVERPVVVDARVLMQSPVVGRSLDHLRPPTTMANGIAQSSYRFSPSLGQTVWVAAQAYEEISAQATLHAVGSRPVLTDLGWAGEWTEAGPALVDLGSRGPLTGALQWQWDGRNTQGQVLEGEYIVVLVSHDDCGHERKDLVPVRVDDTPPQVQWLEPAPGSALTLFQPLRARAQDQVMAQVEFSYSALVGNGQWLNIATQPTSARGPRDYAHDWYNHVAAGTYRLRFRARDEVGLESQADIEVQVPERSPLTLAAELNNELISPNNDGILESTILSLSLGRPALVSVRVLDATGVTRKTLADSVTLNGTQSLTWNGRDQTETPVPDGAYRVALRVVDPVQPAHFEEAEFQVAVDTTPPQLVMRAPAGAFSNGRGALTLEVEEAHPLGAEVSSNPPMPGLLAQHEGGGVLELALLDDDVAEGSYTLSIQAQDRAGNRSQLSHAFTLDRTPPGVSIDTPGPDAVLSRTSGPIAVRVRIDDSHPDGRMLELRQGDSRVALIASETGVGSGPWTAAWAGVEPDGAYTLRVTASDRAGNQGLVDVSVVLDNTPPVARIDSPSAGASVGASFAVTGSATDANFDRFELDLAEPAQPPVFQRVAEGSEPADGLLATVLSPATDGVYLLRLRVHDRAGHVSEVFREVRVDTLPPPAPTQLRVARTGPRDARLSWTAPSPAGDVAGYRLLRNAQVVAEPSGLEHVDTELSEGMHRWQVRAIDAAGNESSPSNQVSLAIDTTPPEVALYAPFNGSRIGGTVAITGRAFSRDDFERWELRVVRNGQPAVVLASGTAAVLNAELVRWNTQGFDGPASLQIEAWDISNNAAVREVGLTIDNQPPAAPVGLVASEAGTSDVQLTWTPNTEADLHGYLVYRGARLLQGDPGGNPLLLAIATPDWLDEDVGDGGFQWRVQAIDTTGNLSAFSDPVSLTRTGRPPRVRLVRPLDGERFDTRVPVRGTSADLDLAEVQFEFRADGASVWTPFGPMFAVPPFDSIFEPAPQAYGFFDLRARSLDQEGLSDPAPPSVRIEHRDLQAPPTPANLRVLVDGEQAMLDWDPVNAQDLASYEVQRAAPGGEFVTVGVVPSPTVAHVDGSLTDGEYRYRIRAVDTSGNQSPAGAAVNARVFSVEVEQPYTPTLETATEWRVRSVVSGQVVADLQSASGSAALPEQAVAAGQWLPLQTLLEPGLSTLTVRVRDGVGNRSKPFESQVLRSERPPAPSNVAATVNAHQVNLSWQMPAYPRPVSFRVFRDGSAREPDAAQTPQSAAELRAQGTPRALPRLIDGASSTGESIDLSGGGVSVLVQLAEPVIVTAFEIQLDAPQAPIALAVEGEWLGNWVRLPATLTDEPGTLSASLGQPYRSQQFRLRLSAADPSVYLREIVVRVRPTQSATSLQETLTDGRYRYRIAAVNQDAFESAQSDPADVVVGDIVPPPAVVLSGQVQGADAQLQWTESNAPDLAAYQVLRGSTPIASITNLANRSYTDSGLPNGAYGYRILAVDQAGNAAPSNQVVLSVDVGTMPAPIGLVVDALPGGGALRLTWQPGTGSNPVYYGVLRSPAEAGPFEQIGDSEVTTYDDEGLVNGTRYYYRVRAFDVIGNGSPESNTASGVPVYADAPVVTPAFHFPTRYGRSVVIPRPTSVIAGRGQPGSIVHVGTGTTSSRQAVIPTKP